MENSLAVLTVHVGRCIHCAMVLEHTNYRSYLKATLAEKVGKNPAFSARAWAKALGMAPSTLSEVLKGTKNLSPAAALRVARKLDLSADETDYFLLLVQFASTRSVELKAQLEERVRTKGKASEVHDLSVDVFKMISDWYHLPILELTQLDGFELTAPSAAARLGISRLEAEVAIERLLRLELLEKDDSGSLKKTHDKWVARAAVPNEGLRNFHRQMLEKAIESLTMQSPKEKFIGSETFAIDPEQKAEADAITEKYFEKMIELSGRARRKSEVYHLGVQFFRVTKKEKDHE